MATQALCAVLFLFGIEPALAQTAKASDVISIRVSHDGDSLEAVPPSGGRYVTRKASAKSLLIRAFGVRGYQIVGGPKWLDGDERYDIVTKGRSLTEEQLQPLLQALIVDRFNLRFHKATKEFPEYLLITSKDGPKFKGSNIFHLSRSLNVNVHNDSVTITGRRMPMQELAKHLGQMTGSKVVDNTGLVGEFDFKIAWESWEGTRNMFPVITAVQDQLGLKLLPVKRPALPVIVIDHMERASASPRS